MMQKLRKYFLKVGFILIFVLLTLGVLSAWVNPTLGFEVSIYQATPLMFWVAIILSIGIGIILTVLNIIHYPLPLWTKYIHMPIIGLATLQVFALFIIRGYYIFNIDGDSGSHVGNLNLLLSSGSTASFYPFLYIQTAVTQLLTNVDLITIMNLTSIIFIIVFLMGIWLSASKICQNKAEQKLILLIACALPFGSSTYMTGGYALSMYIPYIAAFLLFPMAMYTVLTVIEINYTYKKYLIISLIFLIALLFCHMLVFTIFLILLFIILVTTIFFRKKIINYLRVLLILGVIIGVASLSYITWTWIYYQLQNKIIILRDLFQGITDDTYLSKTQNLANVVFSNYNSVWDLIEIIAREGGLAIIFVVILGITSIFLLRIIIEKWQYHNTIPLYILSLVVILIYLLSFITALGFHPGRLMLFLNLSGIFIAGIFFFKLLCLVQSKKPDYKKSLFTIMIILLIFFIMMCGIGSFYRATDTISLSSQTTVGITTGMGFYLTSINYDYDEQTISIAPYRYMHTLYSSDYIRIGSKDYISNYGDFPQPPDHFGYLEQINMGASVNSSTYLSIPVSIIKYYADEIPLKYGNAIYISKDYQHLNVDTSVNKLYENGEYLLYLIYET